MKYIRLLASTSTAVSAAILALLPIFVAIDFGGVLWWTQYVAGLAILLAFLLALTSLADWNRYARPRQLLVMAPLILWLAYSAFQTVTLPPSMVAMLSPGSHAAYTDWLEPILPATQLPQSFPISIAQDNSIHAVAWFGMIAVLAWTSLRVFNTRARLIGLLSCFAITGAIVSVLGVVGLMLPNIPFFETLGSSSGVHFSTFVNRNNAALTMNLGLAASFGLLSWRLSALTGQELDGTEFEFNDLLALTSDRDSAIGVLCTVLCLTGLLVCGSRAGLATVLFASLLSLGWIRKRRGFTTIPVLLISTTILAALLALPLKLDLESIKRMHFFSDSSKTILNDGRFDHWPESWETATNYLPGGSGLSTYSHAYLPYQTQTAKAWFVHADNLWLELLVEQGVVGISFSILLLLVCVGCLHRMAVSHDALDHGLRVSGWYCVGAILFSQTFDFGLVIPANLLLITTLLCAIVTRSVDSDLVQPDESEATRSFLAKVLAMPIVPKIFHSLQAAILVCLMLATYFHLGTLHQDAIADTLTRQADQQLRAGSSGTEPLGSLRLEMSAAIDDAASGKLSYSLAKIQHRMGRMQEVAKAAPQDAEEAKKLYQATSPRYRRLAGRSPGQFMKKTPDGLDQLKLTQAPGEYSEAVENYAAVLSRSPLDRPGREGLLYLDFIKTEEDVAADTDRDRTRTLLSQLGNLYRASPVQLQSLGNLAAQSQQNDLAAKYWKRAMTGTNRRIFRVMDTIKNYKNISLIDALPDDTQVIRSAAKRITQTRDRDNYSILPSMVKKFDCDSCKKSDNKAACLQLAGDVLVAIDQHQESLAYYEQALEVRPSNAGLRLKYIGSLRKLGMTREALTQARLGRQIDSNDKRFDSVIKKMANLEIGGA